MAFDKAISGLQQGRIVMIRPKGNSMEPIIKSGQAVMLRPPPISLEVGQLVLAKVKGSVYFHKITAVDGDRVQIGNNKGHINGWTVKDKVYGIWWQPGEPWEPSQEKRKEFLKSRYKRHGKGSK